MQASSYATGQRVWVKVMDYPWWPAMVVTPEEYGYTATEESGNTCVKFFESDEIGFVNDMDTSEVVPFETSSEKAVAIPGSELEAAIISASAMMDFLPGGEDGRVAANAAMLYAASMPSGFGQQKSLHQRNSDTLAYAMHTHPHAQLASPDYVSRSDTDIQGLADELSVATASNNLPQARKYLVQLAYTHMSYKQLTSTKAGVSVANVMASEQLQPLWQLAQLICRKWAFSLPQTSQRALEHIQKLHIYGEQTEEIM